MPPTIDPSTLVAAVATLSVGAAVFTLVQWLQYVLTTTDVEQDDEWRFDVTRINELRRLSPLYRWFRPVIELFAKFNRAVFASSLPEIRRELQAAGLPRLWLPEEYLARCQLTALLWLPLYLEFGRRLLGPPGIVLGVMLAALTAWWLRRRLTHQVRSRLLAVKRRMPFLLDLVTLLMEAGSTFLNSLEEAVGEFVGQPVSAEFSRVLTDIHLGKTRTEAFEAMRERLDDDDVTSIIGSIIQGEQLGTPLSQVFRTQADLLRIKRTQWAETIAGEAGVNMLLPGILVMGSAVLIILGPFILNYLYFGLSF